MSSSMGPVAAHCDDHDFPRNYADLAWLDRIDREARERDAVPSNLTDDLWLERAFALDHDQPTEAQEGEDR